ncbi:MAG: gliding motility protein GldM [Candidatus Azobacteroides sp.]|nr:gliding motility protein GldM [Candidatus Azobacteroides sp.]
MAGNAPKTPRQKMINLMYIVLTAMLALNVSSDVLNGFTLVEESLKRSIKNALTQNGALYEDLSEYYQKNQTKAQEWYDKGTQIHTMTDSLYSYIQDLKVLIVKEADGANGDVNNVDHVDDLEASNQVMLAPGKGIKNGKKLRIQIDKYRNVMLSMITDSIKRKIIADNLSTEPSAKAKADNKNWEEGWFENMPVAAAMTLLSKLQSDVLYAEGEVLHTLVNNIDVGDFRVNEINAYVIPNSRNVIRGGKYSAKIILAAEDTTQRPSIYVNNVLLPHERGGLYEAPATTTGSHTISGYLEILRGGTDEVLRRNFTDTYNVVEPSATVSATMMNVLYAAYDNPISISVPGVPTNAVTASSNGNGTFTSKGNGQWIAKPSKVGEDFVITVTAQLEGRSQVVANSVFKVRLLPDPTPFIEYKDEGGNVKRYKGGTFSKAALMNADGIMAAIDDGLLNIEFKVVRFETVLFDSMGNAMLELSNGSNFSDRQKDQFRRLSRGKRFYVSRVTAVGPDGRERTISPIEVIVN